MHAPIAFTRDVPAAIIDCELTYLSREPIDIELARRQHAEYEQALADLGLDVHRLPAGHESPDSVFVEDTAVVFDELAILARPGAVSRRDEVAAIDAALTPFRTRGTIRAPGTLDGGDVLVLGREVTIGLSARTNAEGARQFRSLVEPFGYRVRTLGVTGCLHLKSAVTRIGDDALVINPLWIDSAQFPAWRSVECDPREPFGANALRLKSVVVYPSEHPRTAERLVRAGYQLRLVPAGELAKAEGGVTCCSVIVM